MLNYAIARHWCLQALRNDIMSWPTGVALYACYEWLHTYRVLSIRGKPTAPLSSAKTAASICTYD